MSADPKILLRATTEADLPFLFQVYAGTRWFELQQTGWSDEEKVNFLVFQFEAQHKHYQKFYSEAAFDLIVVDEQPVGRLYVHRQEHDIRIVDIAFLPDFRGKGIGTRLLRQLLDEGSAKKTKVSIHVEEHNPAIRLYERLGFRRGELVGVYCYMEATPESYREALAALEQAV